MRRPRPSQRSAPKSFPAPVRGWIENENLAMNAGGGASVMENWYPLAATVRVRGGALRVATIGSAPVLSLLSWRSGTTSKLFAASASAVYDITAMNPDITPAAAFSGQSSGRWSAVQYGTAGGNFLVMVNGTDPARLFDGTAWSAITGVSVPIAITGVSTSALSHLWVHGERIWAVQKNTLSAWHLPTDSVGGAMVEFFLGGVFRRGGSLLFGTTWSSDSGTGMDDRCVFVSDQGEVAVYQGIDPSSAEGWALVGRYDIGPPITAQTIQIGGDVLIATETGIVPLSQVTTKDPATLSMAAITFAIEPAWLRAVRTRDVARPFVMTKWPAESMGIVGLPHRNETFVVNLQTGAWTRYTGWDVQSLTLHDGRVFFGDAAGGVFQAEGAGADDGDIYVARLSMLPDHLGAFGAFKAVRLARGVFRALAPFTPKLSVAMDYGRDFPTPPSVAADPSQPALWDVGLWDVSRWDDSPDSEERMTATTRWVSIGRSGISASVQVQVACGSPRRPDAELVALDMIYQPGGMVV